LNGNSQANSPYAPCPYGPYTPASPYTAAIPNGQNNNYSGNTQNPANLVNPASPAVPPVNPSTPLSQGAQTPTVNPPMQQGPPPVTEVDYIPGYLAANIGRPCRCEFIVGASTYVDRAGTLVDVGVNYFVLRNFITRSDTMCDLYSVRFVTFENQ